MAEEFGIKVFLDFVAKNLKEVESQVKDQFEAIDIPIGTSAGDRGGDGKKKKDEEAEEQTSLLGSILKIGTLVATTLLAIKPVMDLFKVFMGFATIGIMKILDFLGLLAPKEPEKEKTPLETVTEPSPVEELLGVDTGKYIEEGIDWEDWIDPLEWGTWIKDFFWDDKVEDLDWSNSVPDLDWNSPVSDLDWSDSVPELDWTVPVADLDWSDPVPDLDWTDPIEDLDWTIPVPGLKWGLWITKNSWSTWISKLNWGDWIKKKVIKIFKRDKDKGDKKREDASVDDAFITKGGKIIRLNSNDNVFASQGGGGMPGNVQVTNNFYGLTSDEMVDKIERSLARKSILSGGG